MAQILENTQVLIFDCQATRACGSGGQLLETGWCVRQAVKTTPPNTTEMETYRIQLPEDTPIPPAVEKITGITEPNAPEAISPATAWRRLGKAATGLASGNGRNPPFCVIHYARFERPYLKNLHNDFGRGDFPFHIVCTHEIARRLLPHLPRKGLRALAGYFGYPVSCLRRSAHHVAATAVIWSRLTALLKKDRQIDTVADLLNWLEKPVEKRKVPKIYPMEKRLRVSLPDGPGIYRMLRSDGSVLYVGKATSLKKRVNSYFTKKRGHAEHILEMLTQAQDLSFTPTASALEAALLESDEIKWLSPPYNVSLRENGRSVGFASRELNDHAAKPDARHTVGPLPSPTALTPLGLLAGWMFPEKKNPTFEPESGMRQILGFPEAYLPALDCFEKGVRCFADRHEKFMSKCPRDWWEILGLKFWREAAERDRSESDPDEEDPAKSNMQKERFWDPEIVADALESVVRRGAHLIRRGRWFTLLSESTLVWNRPDNQCTAVMLSGGVIERRFFLPEDTSIPTPSSSLCKCRQRLQRMDIAAYDRLRVLTTELRRLIKQGRKPVLASRPGHKWENEQLAGFLFWL